MSDITARRRAALRERLAEQGLDAVLITTLLNVRYLTGFTGSNAALLVSSAEDGTLFCTDGRYTTQAATQVPDLERIIERASDLALAGRASGRVGFEAGAVTVLAHHGLVQASSAELVETQELVEALRAIKDEGEIDALRRACAIADQALAELLAAGGLRPGRTEREVGLDLDQRMRELGAQDPAFETIVAAGPNSAIPHHSPTGSALALGDFVKLDFGARVDGYHSDMTRTVVLGRPADWQREIYALVAEAQRVGREAMVVGADARRVDTAARQIIADAGYGENYTHGLGHGVGLEIHEAPGVGQTAAGTIEADMCVTVEPGVYLPGRGGVRIEDSGVVRQPGSGGYDVLTLTSKDLLEV